MMWTYLVGTPYIKWVYLVSTCISCEFILYVHVYTTSISSGYTRYIVDIRLIITLKYPPSSHLEQGIIITFRTWSIVTTKNLIGKCTIHRIGVRIRHVLNLSFFGTRLSTTFDDTCRWFFMSVIVSPFFLARLKQWLTGFSELGAKTKMSVGGSPRPWRNEWILWACLTIYFDYLLGEIWRNWWGERGKTGGRNRGKLVVEIRRN